MQGLVLVHRQQNLLPAAGRGWGTANHELPWVKVLHLRLLNSDSEFLKAQTG